ncbi:hypothetical protein CcaverHIS002_0403130 [Cutaneotrichosporon cavernicola]|uniref:Gfo/Idh/MocA-like oxidoreductase N-terminal domain-containing protein n=1 Tax=Cutaneotrichosporon cavernicola TaxID=279322 RepID=A0AA48L3W0_9TREE|nr:uncharacterized protein CcaverHIS019_0403090 [Cutaneotrichosporon cavernicola]BEI83709.1 hypothetical protein CcaverHIS002_0403130 [Cutaneotrichosporon cavernicola]BEI91489.1 hypothetical protein CcaverHIS019_0403090 [Cutaneotrichosporon cavernicola]
MDKPLGVAVVGIGEVALNTHLPTLLLCSHLFRTLALVDISPGALQHAASKFHVPKTYTTLDPVLADPEIDVVMIMSANEYHVEQSIAALRAGKHVFVEKPLALTVAGADAVAAAARESGKVCFVGFMRRYAEAFLRVKDMVAGAKFSYVRVRDIIGHNAFFVSQSGSFPLKFDDIPVSAARERAVRSEAMLADALGTHTERDSKTWNLLTGLSSHDISALRELVGMPRRVLSAVRSGDCNWIWATLEYDGFVAYYEVGIDNVRVFDAHIEAYLSDRRVKVSYDTPYVKGLPITASVQYTRDGDHVEETIRPTYEDAFTLEYRAFYDAIVKGTPVKTSPEDAREDVVIFKMIMDAIWAGEI